MSWNLFIIEGTTFVWWKRVVEGQGVPVVKASQNVNHSRDNCHFGTECFQKVTKMKSRTVLHLLKLGFKVMFSDVDVYWFQVNSLPSTASHQVIYYQYKLWEDIRHWVLNHCSKGDLRYTDGHSYVTCNWNYFIGCLLRTWFLLKILFTATKKTLCIFSFRIQSQKWCHMDLALLWHRLTNIMTPVSFYLYFFYCVKVGYTELSLQWLMVAIHFLWYYFWRVWKGNGQGLFPLRQTFHWNP